MSSDRIALDVMGGDNAPGAILDGALAACDAASENPLPPSRILLVGDEAVIRPALAERNAPDEFEILHAPSVIGMDEKPAQALRSKRDASIPVATGAVKKGHAGAIVSMGNTGAMVGSATLGLGTLAGVRRPGIAVTLRLSDTPLTLLDMGANIAPHASDLMQYGVMGATLQRDCMGVESPRVGLLNIGEEKAKGTDLLKEARDLLDSTDLPFVGNVEGGDLFTGGVDVVVTDGFTGNVVLKLLEGFAGFMLGQVMRELAGHGADWAPAALAKLKKNIDYAEYGGALLLGVDGVVIIGHGRSDAMAVANALRVAARALDVGVNQHIVAGLAGVASKGGAQG
jgi:phosphate acyltransferase